MIRLNLTNQPGIQFVDESEKFDVEGLMPDTISEEQKESPAEKSAEKPKTASVSNIDEIPEMPLEPELSDKQAIPEVDDDLFKMAEANLDLIEQAEEEEAGIGKKVKEASLPEEKKEKRRRRHPLLRYAVLVTAIVLVFIVLWFYKNGQLNRQSVEVTTRETAQVVTDKVEEVSQSTGQRVREYSDRLSDASDQVSGLKEQVSAEAGNAARQMSSELTSARQQVSSRLSDVRTSQRTVQQPYGASELHAATIRQIQIGQDKLAIAASVLSQFPKSANLQYLRIKNDKLSFIVSVSSETTAEQIRNYFSGLQRFQEPEVFFVERNDKNLANPVEIMAIIRFRTLISDDTKGYKYLTDRQLSQFVWQAALKSAVKMDPLKISNQDFTKVRNAELTGSGGSVNVIDLLRELALQRHNMTTAVLSVKTDGKHPLEDSILEYNLNTIIYPGNI